MDDELAAALELERRLYVGAGERVVALDHGWVVRHHTLAGVHFLNAVVLPGPLPESLDADGVAALADEGLADAGHRLVVVLDDAAGERLSPGLTALGFEQRRTLYMALRGDPGRALRDPRVRELSEPELRELQQVVFEDDNVGPHATPQLPGLLADGQAALRTAGIARGFGAGQSSGGNHGSAGSQSGELQSTAMLFLDPEVNGRRVAMVEQVGTLRSHRLQGLARATVSAALRAAGEWGAELIVIPTDAEDWPQLFYANLGFAPIGRVWAFTRHDRGHSP